MILTILLLLRVYRSQDMIMCVTQTRNELILFFFIIMVASVLFGSAIFYCEKDSENSLYVSIPGRKVFVYEGEAMSKRGEKGPAENR